MDPDIKKALAMVVRPRNFMPAIFHSASSA
jgi:hypothetical protein